MILNGGFFRAASTSSKERPDRARRSRQSDLLSSRGARRQHDLHHAARGVSHPADRAPARHGVLSPRADHSATTTSAPSRCSRTPGSTACSSRSRVRCTRGARRSSCWTAWSQRGVRAVGGGVQEFIHELQTISGMTGCTVLLLSSTERAGGFRPEHTMVDGLIELGDTWSASSRCATCWSASCADRTSCAAATDGDLIGGHQDPPAYRDPAAQPRRGRPGAAPRRAGRLRCDRARRDAARRPAGWLEHHRLGPRGAGRTMLAGSSCRGVRGSIVGLYVGFYERPASLLRQGHPARARLGWRPRAQAPAPVLGGADEGVLDAVVERVLRAVVDLEVKRLCFDGLHGFRHPCGVSRSNARRCSRAGPRADPARRHHAVHPGDPGAARFRHRGSDRGCVLALDNIILRATSSCRSQLHRLISILRCGIGLPRCNPRVPDHRPGVVVADTFDSAEQIPRVQRVSLSSLNASADRASRPMAQSSFIVDANLTRRHHAELSPQGATTSRSRSTAKLGLASLAMRRADMFSRTS